VLIRVAGELKRWLVDEHDVATRALPYHVERGGIYLKDAAVLAGLGVIGANNLLITPTLGPRVRWKALLLDLEPPAPPAADWDPCDGCERPCLKACPQQAFPRGRYDLERCSVQMKLDEANPQTAPADDRRDLPPQLTVYCRACELACPVGAGAPSRP
jgi:epoxyqueuosine reductase